MVSRFLLWNLKIMLRVSDSLFVLVEETKFDSVMGLVFVFLFFFSCTSI